MTHCGIRCTFSGKVDVMVRIFTLFLVLFPGAVFALETRAFSALTLNPKAEVSQFLSAQFLTKPEDNGTVVTVLVYTVRDGKIFSVRSLAPNKQDREGRWTDTHVIQKTLEEKGVPQSIFWEVGLADLDLSEGENRIQYQLSLVSPQGEYQILSPVRFTA